MVTTYRNVSRNLHSVIFEVVGSRLVRGLKHLCAHPCLAFCLLTFNFHSTVDWAALLTMLDDGGTCSASDLGVADGRRLEKRHTPMRG